MLVDPPKSRMRKFANEEIRLLLHTQPPRGDHAGDAALQPRAQHGAEFIGCGCLRGRCTPHRHGDRFDLTRVQLYLAYN